MPPSDSPTFEAYEREALERVTYCRTEQAATVYALLAVGRAIYDYRGKPECYCSHCQPKGEA